MEIRNLNTQDVFNLIKIFGKIGFKAELKEFASKVNEMNQKNRKYIDGGSKDEKLKSEIEGIQTELGMCVPLIFIDNFEKAEKEISKFLASISDKNEKEFLEMDAEQMVDLIIELKESKEFASFFTKALKLFNK